MCESRPRDAERKPGESIPDIGRFAKCQGTRKVGSVGWPGNVGLDEHTPPTTIGFCTSRHWVILPLVGLTGGGAGSAHARARVLPRNGVHPASGWTLALQLLRLARMSQERGIRSLQLFCLNTRIELIRCANIVRTMRPLLLVSLLIAVPFTVMPQTNNTPRVQLS